MSWISLDQALEEIKSAESFLLTTHTHPDGDAIGSLSLIHISEPTRPY